MKKDYYVLAPRKNRENQAFLTRVAISIKTTLGLDLFAGLNRSFGAFLSPKVTIHYPLETAPLSPRYRAVHTLQRLLESENERCIGCGLCEKICTSNCIRIITNRGEDGRKKILNYSINFGRCIYCGLCAEVCPELAIVHSGRFESASEQRALFGNKSTLLESTSSPIEFSGFGSVSFNADTRVKQTPLSEIVEKQIALQDSQILTQEDNQTSSATSPAQETKQDKQEGKDV